MLLLEKRRKQANDILTQFFLTLQPRVEVRRVIDESVVEDLSLPDYTRSEVFDSSAQPAERPLRVGQCPIRLRRQSQSGSCSLLRQLRGKYHGVRLCHLHS